MRKYFNVLAVALFSLTLFGCGLLPDKPETGWKVAKVVDEFGDQTKGNSVVGLFTGKMSNSVTSGGMLTVKVQIGDDNKTTLISFQDYGKFTGSLPQKKLFYIKVKKQDGSTELVEVFSMYDMIAETEGVLLDMILSQGEPLKVNVDLEAVGYNNTVYNFEIPSVGLSELINGNKQ